MLNTIKMEIPDHNHTFADRPRVIVICGPTGLGKTGFAIELAHLFQAEIVSADSMQVYRHMNIGTAKPTIEEQIRVRHHMIDIIDPDEPFDAAQYAKIARKIVGDLYKKDILPFIVGGTGLYIRALLHGLFQSHPPDPEIRKRLLKEVNTIGLSDLYRRLAVFDPAAAAKIHSNDGFRIIRALEVMEATGKKMSAFHQAHRFFDRPFKVLTIGLYMDREKLYHRINLRADTMIKEGLLKEVEDLLSNGYDPNLKAMQSIGYRHMVHFIQGHLTWDETVRILKRDTRRYAKRQLTWFKGESGVVWESPDNVLTIRQQIEDFVQDDK